MLGPMTDSVLRVIPLGGLGEVGKNMTVFEIAGQMLVVDAGLAFPRDEHLGVDLVLPDFGYLEDREVLAVVLTHAHEDHVGALPYLLREVRVHEVWATRLTLGMIGSKLDEHGLQRSTELREIDPEGPPLDLGPFRLEFVRMAHSVPDAVGIAIETAAGRVFHTGDWKLDHTPIDGLRTDVGKLAELGNRGVDLLLGDSTNAERPGFTRSERVVGEAFRQIIPQRTGRVLITSFASNIHRMQQAIDVAAEVEPQGRGDRPLDEEEPQHRAQPRLRAGARRHPRPAERPRRPRPGTAADPLHGLAGRAALGADADRLQRPSGGARRARRHGDHVRARRARERAARPRRDQPPHAERRRGAARGELAGARLGPRLRRGDAHAARPRPAEGDDADPRRVPDAGRPRAAGAGRRRAGHAIVIAENGDVVELSREGVRIADHVESGVTFVDGLGVGDISDVALRDRRHLSEDGVLIVVTTLSNGTSAAPELISRGFAESDELMAEMRHEAHEIVRGLLGDDIREIKLLQEHIHDGIGQLVYDRTRRRPMILPVVVEV